MIRDEARCTPNLRATQVELYDGLVADSQNRWPSLDFDVRRVNDLLSPLLPAGFYYKTFMWPRAAWHKLYEPFIRRAAGLGEPPTQPDPDRYCAALRALRRAGRRRRARRASPRRWRPRAGGARVILCDEQPELGGSLLDEPTARSTANWPRDWIARCRRDAALRDPNVTLLTRTTASATSRTT